MRLWVIFRGRNILQTGWALLNLTSWLISSENINSSFVRQIRCSKNWKSRSLVEEEAVIGWVRAAGGLCTVCVFTCEWVLMREKFAEIEPLAMCETCWSACHKHICLVLSVAPQPQNSLCFILRSFTPQQNKLF